MACTCGTWWPSHVAHYGLHMWHMMAFTCGTWEPAHVAHLEAIMCHMCRPSHVAHDGLFYSLSLSFLSVYRLVLWGWGLWTDRVYITLSQPCTADLFNNNNNNNNDSLHMWHMMACTCGTWWPAHVAHDGLHMWHIMAFTCGTWWPLNVEHDGFYMRHMIACTSGTW